MHGPKIVIPKISCDKMHLEWNIKKKCRVEIVHACTMHPVPSFGQICVQPARGYHHHLFEPPRQGGDSGIWLESFHWLGVLACIDNA